MPAVIDLTNQKFGKLIALERIGSTANGKSLWKCLCVCGRYKEVISGNLIQKLSTSCGTCYKIPDLLYKQFGNLKVKEYLGIWANSKTKNVAHWLCVDKNGIEKIMRTAELVALRRVNRNTPRNDEDSAYMNLYRKYRHGAKKRNLEFIIAYQEFKNLIQQKCFYCHGQPDNFIPSRKNGAKFKYNGIDRMENKKGYTIDNCITCCIICNRAKSNLSLEKWYNYINRFRSIEMDVTSNGI